MNRGISSRRFTHHFGKGTVSDHPQRNATLQPFPRGDQGGDSLFRSETTDEESIAALTCARPGIRIHEVWLYRDPRRREASLDELTARELRQRDISIDAAGPGSK